MLRQLAFPFIHIRYDAYERSWRIESSANTSFMMRMALE